MTDHSNVHCYAVRRLNPFLGVLQVTETAWGRASTANGVAWHIELLLDKPRGWGSLFSDSEEQEWFLYGLWSEQEGLVTLPSLAQIDNAKALSASEQIIGTIKSNQSRMPYALADLSELWLLDAVEEQPLALLFSMLPGSRPPSPEPRNWRGCLGLQGTGGQRRFPEIAQLEAAVRKRAGFNPKRLWVTWDGEHQYAKTTEGEEITGDLFPAYGIREEWSQENIAALASRYIDWISPSLLTIPYLSNAGRARLESRLERQANSVEYHWRLYPKILDENKVRVARVRARLQESGSDPQ